MARRFFIFRGQLKTRRDGCGIIEIHEGQDPEEEFKRIERSPYNAPEIAPYYADPEPDDFEFDSEPVEISEDEVKEFYTDPGAFEKKLKGEGRPV